MGAEIDHLIVGAPELEAGVRHVEQSLGARPAPGGRHPDLGTRNALLSLGGKTYLEVLAPDPVGPVPEGPLPFGIDELEVPRLVTWCARAPDLSALVEGARARGLDLGEVKAGSRTRPDGSTLTWRVTDVSRHLAGGVIPFFIDWGDSEHPGGTAPPGGTLEELRIVHPEPELVGEVLAGLGLDLPVEAGEGPGLVAEIRTDEGLVELQ